MSQTSAPLSADSRSQRCSGMTWTMPARSPGRRLDVRRRHHVRRLPGAVETAGTTISTSPHGTESRPRPVTVRTSSYDLRRARGRGPPRPHRAGVSGPSRRTRASVTLPGGRRPPAAVPTRSRRSQVSSGARTSTAAARWKASARRTRSRGRQASAAGARCDSRRAGSRCVEQRLRCRRPTRTPGRRVSGARAPTGTSTSSSSGTPGRSPDRLDADGPRVAPAPCPGAARCRHWRRGRSPFVTNGVERAQDVDGRVDWPPTRAVGGPAR